MKKQKLLTILLAAVLGGTMPAAAKTEIPDEIRPYDITIHTYEDNPVILKGFSVEGVRVDCGLCGCAAEKTPEADGTGGE